MISLRPAENFDREFLRTSFLTSLQPAITAARGEWNEARESAQFQRQLDLANTQVIEGEEARIGFFMIRPTGVDLELHTLCIVPRYQGHGLGSEVTRLIIQLARTRHLGVVLSVLTVNDRARTFFERIGFVQIDASARHIRLRHVSRESLE